MAESAARVVFSRPILGYKANILPHQKSVLQLLMVQQYLSPSREFVVAGSNNSTSGNRFICRFGTAAPQW